MDETAAHFMVVIGEVCSQARTGKLPVAVVLRDGRTVTGLPAPRAAAGRGDEPDSTGFGPELEVGGETIRLDEIVEIRLHAPV